MYLSTPDLDLLRSSLFCKKGQHCAGFKSCINVLFLVMAAAESTRKSISRTFNAYSTLLYTPYFRRIAWQNLLDMLSRAL